MSSKLGLIEVEIKSSKLEFRSGNWNHDCYQSSFLITRWICWKFHDIGLPSNLSEGVWKHKVWSKNIYTEKVCFLTDICHLKSLLNNLWNISDRNFFMVPIWMLIVMLNFCVKESRNLIGFENFGTAAFSITAGFRWYSLFLIFPHKNLTPPTITWSGRLKSLN